MSYDLTLEGAAIGSEIARLAKRFGCEHHGDDSRQTICLQVDDAAVVKLYRALVKLAKTSDAVLHDPQYGASVDLAAPGRFPPMWGPTGPVHGRSFNAKIKSVLLDHLRPHGFTVRDKWTAVRPGEHMTQGINFQAGTGSRSGSFTANIYWTFDFRPLVHPSQMTASTRLERFVLAAGIVPPDHPSRGWLPTAPPARLERAFAQLLRLLDEAVLPRLDAARTIAGVIELFESGTLAPHAAFGHSADDMADCYRYVGRLAEGRALRLARLAPSLASDDPGTVRWAEGERARTLTAFAEVPA